MTAVRPGLEPRSLYGSILAGALVAVVAFTLPLVNLLAPFLGGGVAGALWDGSPSEGGVVGAFAGLVAVVPVAAVGALVRAAGVPVATLLPGAAPLLDMVVVGPSGPVVYRVSAFVLLGFCVAAGLGGGVVGGADETFY